MNKTDNFVDYIRATYVTALLKDRTWVQDPGNTCAQQIYEKEHARLTVNMSEEDNIVSVKVLSEVYRDRQSLFSATHSTLCLQQSFTYTIKRNPDDIVPDFDTLRKFMERFAAITNSNYLNTCQYLLKTVSEGVNAVTVNRE